MDIVFRRATAADAPEVATVYIASRRAAAEWLPTVGTDEEIRAFVIWLLQYRAYPLSKRLAILGALCDELQELAEDGSTSTIL